MDVNKGTFAQSPAYQKAIRTLDTARREVYYDEEADLNDCAAYYQAISLEKLDPEQLYQQLHQLLRETHQHPLDYSTARHEHLYTNVDLHPDGLLHSIYTGEAYKPEEVIQDDMALYARHLHQAKQQLQSLPLMQEETFAQHLAALETNIVYNAEHVVPQSWFDKRSPMRADLHHLFTCEPACNSYRGNVPFFEFPDYQEAIRQGCGKREAHQFEPAQGHGPVARATLYFLLRYPGEINDNSKEYPSDRIQVLVDWHRLYPVSTYEQHRNAEISKVQGNRNPLIDHPAWADRINFISGLG